MEMLSKWDKNRDMRTSSVFISLAVPFFLALGGLSSCATPPVHLGEAVEGVPRTSFLLNYTLSEQAEGPAWDHCVITFNSLDSKATYEMALSSHRRSIRVEVPVGDYAFKKLSCKQGGEWVLDSFGAPKVTAYSGKVSYLGSYGFKISRQEKVYELSLDRGNREQMLGELRETVSHLSSKFHNKLVSAFNGRSMDMDFIRDGKLAHPETVSHLVGEKVPLQHLRFDSCEAKEFHSNPAAVGPLTYHATFDRNEILKLEQLENRSTFTDGFIACVEKTIRSFQPGYSKPVSFDIRF